MKSKDVEKVLVTGGAGFIGSHVVDLLVESNYETIVLDSLEEQVHGNERVKPDYLNPSARFLLGNVLDRGLLDKVLPDVDAVIHLAALVGVGQSMYKVHRYVDSNTSGTAMLLDAVVNAPNPIRKVVVASSMSIYGEGKYYCEACRSAVYPDPRSFSQLQARKWNHACPTCGTSLMDRPTDERTPSNPASVYAMSKRDQEEMALLIGKSYGIPTVALRLFNVYGPRQALSNPYTGACAIFSSRILNGKPPYLFEDGMQLRDFIHVRDVARAVVLALQRADADYMPINIGSGRRISILELAKALVEHYGAKMEPYVSGEFRKGDTRHCYADITLARKLLGFEPSIGLREGLADLAGWGKTHGWGSVDLFENALKELREKRLT
jgi:dTDP-L-rhamnose 4-epimerase